jgi:amino acid permease
MVQTFSSLVFCFVSHQLVFPLIRELKRPTNKRVNKVFFRVHVTEVVIYFFVGLAGYLLLVEHISIFPIGAMVMASIQTIPMSIGKLLTCITLFLAVPLNLFPAR